MCSAPPVHGLRSGSGGARCAPRRVVLRCPTPAQHCHYLAPVVCRAMRYDNRWQVGSGRAAAVTRTRPVPPVYVMPLPVPWWSLPCARQRQRRTRTSLRSLVCSRGARHAYAVWCPHRAFCVVEMPTALVLLSWDGVWTLRRPRHGGISGGPIAALGTLSGRPARTRTRALWVGAAAKRGRSFPPRSPLFRPQKWDLGFPTLCSAPILVLPWALPCTTRRQCCAQPRGLGPCLLAPLRA